jgi:prolyl-tRNA editing enzyme YbaK/EbsC (Cys-tRNA(Pro) deacylase)
LDKRSIDRVRATLAEHGMPEPEVKEFSASTATAAEAAKVLGTSVERIVKSLVFMAETKPVLALVSGPSRADVAKLSALVGEPVRRANAAEVRDATGFAIGGVPPVGFPTSLDVFIDRDLLQYDELWAAAGNPHSVFRVEPQQLVRITRGRVVDLTSTSTAES